MIAGCMIVSIFFFHCADILRQLHSYSFSWPLIISNTCRNLFYLYISRLSGYLGEDRRDQDYPVYTDTRWCLQGMASSDGVNISIQCVCLHAWFSWYVKLKELDLFHYTSAVAHCCIPPGIVPCCNCILLLTYADVNSRAYWRYLMWSLCVMGVLKV